MYYLFIGLKLIRSHIHLLWMNLCQIQMLNSIYIHHPTAIIMLRERNPIGIQQMQLTNHTTRSEGFEIDFIGMGVKWSGVEMKKEKLLIVIFRKV